jgi:hypothetical protein
MAASPTLLAVFVAAGFESGAGMEPACRSGFTANEVAAP